MREQARSVLLRPLPGYTHTLLGSFRHAVAKARLVQDTVKVGELESKIGQLVDQEADLLEEEAALKEDIQAKKRAEFEAERKLMRANDELSTLGVY